MQRLGIELKMAFAVAVRDSYSGRPLMGSQAWVSLPEDPRNKPITKRDGYYVVLKGLKKITRFEVHAPGFYSRAFEVDEEILEETGGILTVWMVPDPTYIGAGNSLQLGISGAGPGEIIRVISLNHLGRVKLLSDAGQGNDSMHVFQAGSADLSGRKYAVLTPSGDEISEIVHLVKLDQGGNYRLRKPLEKSYKKFETFLYPICDIEADQDGKGLVLLKPDKENGRAECLVVTMDAAARKLSLEKEIQNTLEL